jgi:hypothetical protein
LEQLTLFVPRTSKRVVDFSDDEGCNAPVTGSATNGHRKAGGGSVLTMERPTACGKEAL